ncbi:MAG: NAD-dependent succinate-semialdehyde dehydrogenase [Alphaproteobacteria bacterium]|jgi:succinate-semialdehyde dehydrogenase/glutarate-semialdehyde dehydrogenase|nr:NAD-dependent succinate-semialdehyde dehydrogenase [Candidatus Jidaibacter sp.]
MTIHPHGLINGSWVENKAELYDVINPADMSVISSVAKLGKTEAELAIESAHTAFRKWRNTTAKERSKILRKLSDLIHEHKEIIAKIMVMESGKAWAEAIGEIDYASSFLEWFSEEAKRTYGDIIPSVKYGQRLFTTREPVGVVAAIAPWNFPLAMITRKLAPALAAGCTIVIKPSEETPLTAYYLGKLCMDAGVPAGVVNILSGNAQEIGDAMTESDLVSLFTFTGSTPVGKTLTAKCAATVKKVALELGGNAPFIVFDDANLEKAADGLIASKLRSGGQSCICANRIFVADSVMSDFEKILVTKLQILKVGNGLDKSNHIGTTINAAAARKIESLVADAASNGAALLYAADISEQKKLSPCFVGPTLLRNAKVGSKIEETEIFGPVISMFSFKSEDEVLERANRTNYGLASYFYAENNARIWRVAERLEYGMVGINDVAISSEVSCFGGIKQSGLGREAGKHGIDEYMEYKYMVMS